MYFWHVLQKKLARYPLQKLVLIFLSYMTLSPLSTFRVLPFDRDKLFNTNKKGL